MCTPIYFTVKPTFSDWMRYKFFQCEKLAEIRLSVPLFLAIFILINESSSLLNITPISSNILLLCQYFVAPIVILYIIVIKFCNLRFSPDETSPIFQKTNYKLTKDHLEISNSLSKTKHTWEAIKEITTDKRCIYLWLDNHTPYIIPKPQLKEIDKTLSIIEKHSSEKQKNL